MPGPLEASVERLEVLGVVPAIAGRLAGDAGTVGASMHGLMVEEIEAFSVSGNPDVIPQMEAHGREHVEAIIALVAGKPQTLDFVRAHARRRAEQRFPLDAVLHAYRIGNRVMSRWLRDHALAMAGNKPGAREIVAAMADFAIEYTDAISNIIAAEYVQRTRELAGAEGDRRAELLAMLIAGYDESDARIARLLRNAGLSDQRQTYCVVLAEPADPAEMQSASRAGRLVDAMREALDSIRVRHLVGIHESRVVGVIADVRRVSGWSAPQSSLADRATPALRTLGNAVHVGVSADAPSTARVPKALREARLALDVAGPSRRVVGYCEVPIRYLLLHNAGEAVQSALPAWAEQLANADRKGTLASTLNAFADNRMNVTRTAEALRVHANTVYARLAKVNELTGLDPLDYHGLTELLLALELKAR